MRIITSIVLLSISFFSFAQIPVDHLPHNKNVLIEEFTGVQCNSCPNGHMEINNLLNAYPNRVFAAGMHAQATGHTAPYPGEEDLRRPFPSALWPKIPDKSGIPSGIISRRAFANGKEAYTFWVFAAYHKPIDTAVNIVMSEPSPINIGIVATYDSVNKNLIVNSQVYTTATSTGTYRLNVYFTQSNIRVSQLNGSTVIPLYNEKHVFREILTPTWGTNIYTSGTTQGDISNSTLTFSNSTNNYKMKDVEVLVFVTKHSSSSSTDKGTVVQVKGVKPTLTGAISTGINELVKVEELSVYPNPSAKQIYIHVKTPSLDNEVIISDVNGKIVFRKEIHNENTTYVDHDLAPGVYFVSIRNNPGVVKKLIVQ